MKTKYSLLGLTVIAVTALFTTPTNAQTNVMPPFQILIANSQDLSNLEATVKQVEASTNGLSFTNTSFYVGSGWQNADGVNGAQQAYIDAQVRVARFSAFDLGIGGAAVFGDTGSTLHTLDLRVDALKDISNFQVYGGPDLKYQFDHPGGTGDPGVGLSIGLNIGVRYNLSAGLAGSTNPILSILAGSTSIHTYAQTEFDMDVPLARIDGGLTIDRLWKVGVGISF